MGPKFQFFLGGRRAVDSQLIRERRSDPQKEHRGATTRSQKVTLTSTQHPVCFGAKNVQLSCLVKKGETLFLVICVLLSLSNLSKHFMAYYPSTTAGQFCTVHDCNLTVFPRNIIVVTKRYNQIQKVTNADDRKQHPARPFVAGELIINRKQLRNCHDVIRSDRTESDSTEMFTVVNMISPVFQTTSCRYTLMRVVYTAQHISL